jgi:hypothetical protein
MDLAQRKGLTMLDYTQAGLCHYKFDKGPNLARFRFVRASRHRQTQCRCS